MMRIMWRRSHVTSNNRDDIESRRDYQKSTYNVHTHNSVFRFHAGYKFSLSTINDHLLPPKKKEKKKLWPEQPKQKNLSLITHQKLVGIVKKWCVCVCLTVHFQCDRRCCSAPEETIDRLTWCKMGPAIVHVHVFRSVMSFNSLLIYIYVFPIVNMRIAHVKCAYQISWRRPLTQNVQITRWTATGCMVPLKWVDLFVWSADCGMREIFDEVEHDFDSSI